MSENKYQQPPADAEQVERVARAMYDSVPHNHGDSWDVGVSIQAHFRCMATAAIRAIAAMGGKRWGVWDVELDCWFKGHDSGGTVFVTTDRNAAEWMKDDLLGYPGREYQVREYVEQAKESEHERLARIGHETFQKALGRATFIPFHKLKPEWKAACIAQAAAIENARKGADCGDK